MRAGEKGSVAALTTAQAVQTNLCTLIGNVQHSYKLGKWILPGNSNLIEVFAIRCASDWTRAWIYWLEKKQRTVRITYLTGGTRGMKVLTGISEKTARALCVDDVADYRRWCIGNSCTWKLLIRYSVLETSVFWCMREPLFVTDNIYIGPAFWAPPICSKWMASITMIKRHIKQFL